MSAYQYVVFPPGRQPVDSDIRELQRYASALAGRYAFGVCRNETRLAIAFERQTFDHVMRIEPGFETLIQKWQSHGCELIDHLAFVKNAAALRPTPSYSFVPHDGRATKAELREHERLAAKQLAAREAVGRSLLSVEQTLERFAAVERLAAAAPYALMALAAALTIGVGLHVRDRLLNADRAPRRAVIEQSMDEPSRSAGPIE
jgi:hypothetical protein